MFNVYQWQCTSVRWEHWRQELVFKEKDWAQWKTSFIESWSPVDPGWTWLILIIWMWFTHPRGSTLNSHNFHKRSFDLKRVHWTILFWTITVIYQDRTYIPSTRNMLHIVLGAQAWGDMAEVQLFGDYLNLHGYSIAARGGGMTEEGRGRVRRPGGMRGSEKRWQDQRTQEEERTREREESRGEERSHHHGLG